MRQGSTALERPDAAEAARQRMSEDQFAKIRALLNDHVGIAIKVSRRSRVESRVNSRLRELGIETYGGYLDFLLADESGRELVQLIDAISTNVTEFFREREHFDFVSALAARWLARGRRKLRFWSAACSSGEEAYSLAMTLRALPGAAEADIRILATDISTRMLRTAVQGTYLEETAATIPAELAERFLLRRPTPDGDVYRVTDELKNMIVFRRQNLNETPYGIRGPFDLIMCRNVMIYFDQDLRERIVAEAHRLLGPGGYLLVGHAETLIGVENRFDFVGPAIYRRN